MRLRIEHQWHQVMAVVVLLIGYVFGSVALSQEARVDSENIVSDWMSITNDQPGWSNSVGWNDPAKYSTIQAVAVGNELYLIGKADDGIQTYSSDFVRLERERKFFPAMQPGAHRDAADI